MTTSVAASLEDHGPDRGPGLFARTFRQADGTESPPVVTNLKLAGPGRKPGAWLINIATALLLLLAVALYVVSISAQWSYVMDIKHDNVVSWIEAASLDGGMAVFTLLALGLSRAGQAARIERVFIVACALGSAWMNWEAANTADLRSLTAYVGPPLFLAAVVDRTVSVIRRHYLGDDDGSAWSQLGRAALYAARFVLAPVSTATGARRWVLASAPVPEPVKAAPAPEPTREIEATAPALPRSDSWPVTGPADSTDKPAADTARPARRQDQPTTRQDRATGPSKTSQFLQTAADEYGNGDVGQIPLTDVYSICKSLAPKFELHDGSARTALRKAVLAAQEVAK